MKTCTLLYYPLFVLCVKPSWQTAHRDCCPKFATGLKIIIAMCFCPRNFHQKDVSTQSDPAPYPPQKPKVANLWWWSPPPPSSFVHLHTYIILKVKILAHPFFLVELVPGEDYSSNSIVSSLSFFSSFFSSFYVHQQLFCIEYSQDNAKSVPRSVPTSVTTLGLM